MPVTTRRATLDDLDALAPLFADYRTFYSMTPDLDTARRFLHERLSRGIPLKRIGEPDDVAYCVLYLASDESKFVTGSEFKIDGGMTAQ